MEDKPKRSLREIRSSKGLSLRDMAKLVGCSHPHYNNLEKGRIQPRLRTARRISERLGVPLDELFPPAASSGPG